MKDAADDGAVPHPWPFRLAELGDRYGVPGDRLDAAAGVYNSRPSQQRNSLRRAGDGGDVPRVISGRRIGAACANTLDPNC